MKKVNGYLYYTINSPNSAIQNRMIWDEVLMTLQNAYSNRLEII